MWPFSYLLQLFLSLYIVKFYLHISQLQPKFNNYKIMLNFASLFLWILLSIDFQLFSNYYSNVNTKLGNLICIYLIHLDALFNKIKLIIVRVGQILFNGVKLFFNINNKFFCAHYHRNPFKIDSTFHFKYRFTPRVLISKHD